MMHGYPAVVLAAGASRRMGRPKPLLDFSGRPCLEIVLEACRDGGCGAIILVLGAEADRVRAGCRLGPGVAVVLNEDWERGQTGSVKAGVRSVPEEAEAFFVLPADHPLVEAGDLAVLAERFRGLPAGKGIVIPTHEGRRGHPVLLARRLGEAILALDDGAPLHDLIRARSAEIEQVPVANAGVVTGINTEEDYRAAAAEYRRRRGPKR